MNIRTITLEEAYQDFIVHRKVYLHTNLYTVNLVIQSAHRAPGWWLNFHPVHMRSRKTAVIYHTQLIRALVMAFLDLRPTGVLRAELELLYCILTTPRRERAPLFELWDKHVMGRGSRFLPYRYYRRG